MQHVSSSPATPSIDPLPAPDIQAQPKSKRGPVHLLAGSTGGLISAALLQPFDVIKTRIQQGSHGSLLSVLRGTLAGPAAAATTTDALAPLAGPQARAGLHHLWRGTLPSVLRSGLGSGLYFATLHELRSLCTAQDQPLSPGANLWTGAAARASVGFIMMPVTVIKVRFESSLFHYRSMRHAARAIAKENGLRGFFYGSAATALRDAPHAGLYVSLYEASKGPLSALLSTQVMRQDTDRDRHVWAVNFGSGLIAGSAATLLTNPFDVVRTRAQLAPAKYPSLVKAAVRLAREEGLRCFLDGVGLRMVRKSVSSAFTWSLYELILAQAT